jgi:hypothetical protein
MVASRVGAMVAMACLVATSAYAEPRVSVMFQWTAGAEGAALTAFGELVIKGAPNGKTIPCRASRPT